jgi:hypothetical protein
VGDETEKTEEVPVVVASELDAAADGTDPPQGEWSVRRARIVALCICAVLLVAGGAVLGTWLGSNGQTSSITGFTHPSGATGSTGTANSGSTGGGNSGSGSAATGAVGGTGGTGGTGTTGDTGSGGAGAGGVSSAGSTGTTGAGNSGAGGSAGGAAGSHLKRRRGREPNLARFGWDWVGGVGGVGGVGIESDPGQWSRRRGRHDAGNGRCWVGLPVGRDDGNVHSLNAPPGRDNHLSVSPSEGSRAARVVTP